MLARKSTTLFLFDGTAVDAKIEFHNVVRCDDSVPPLKLYGRDGGLGPRAAQVDNEAGPASVHFQSRE